VKKNKKRRLAMRVARLAQNEYIWKLFKTLFGVQLKELSELLSEPPEIVTLLSVDLVDDSLNSVGRKGLSVHNIDLHSYVDTKIAGDPRVNASCEAK
jgi:hypothetical protein